MVAIGVGGKRIVALVLAGWFCVLLAGHPCTAAPPQGKPAGEMRWALYVTLATAWFDPGEVVGVLTPFWVLYAIHKAGSPMGCECT
jgi:hypothetical protein